MTKRSFVYFGVLALSPISLSGCGGGLFVPDMNEFYEMKAEERVHEGRVVSQVKCELAKGVQAALAGYTPTADKSIIGNDPSWLKKWGAKVTLKLSVDEKTSLNPGVTFFRTFQNALKTFPVNGNITAPQNFSAILAGQASADATRIEVIDFTYQFEQLLKEEFPENCNEQGGIFIDSDLKIKDFILNKVHVASLPGAVEFPPNSPGPFGTFSDEITFVVTFGGGVTPVWRFVDISGSTNSPLFNTQRSKTNDVTISLGPTTVAKDKTAVMNPVTLSIHTSLLNGQFTASAIANQLQR